MSGSNLCSSGPSRRRCLGLLLGSTLLLTTAANAAKPTNPPSDPGSINLDGGFVEHMGLVSADDAGVALTNEMLRHMAVSIGQLAGINPETGKYIHADNLLSLAAWDLDISGDATFHTNVSISGDTDFWGDTHFRGDTTRFYGAIYGNGAGISNLPVDSIQGSLATRPEIIEALDTKANAIWSVVYANTNRITGLELASADTNNPHRVTAEQLEALPCSGGSMHGPIDMGGMAQVINLPEPANDQDAVSKSYLERRLNYIEPQGDIGMGIYTNHP